MSIDNKVIVSVSGGIAEFVYAPKGVECFLVDWDSLEDAHCPLCNVELECGMCPECEFNYNADEFGNDDFSAEQVVENYCKIKGIE
jgi:hypothetical protein